MFITADDLKSSIYEYQVEQITEGDEDITLRACNAAIDEVGSYLCSRYDIDTIFATTDDERNDLLVSLTVSVATFRLVELCNIDIIFEQSRQRYDRAVAYLKLLASGDADMPDLPKLETDTDENPHCGSRRKFHHDW